jgi:hypothetical protein
MGGLDLLRHPVGLLAQIVRLDSCADFVDAPLTCVSAALIGRSSQASSQSPQIIMGLPRPAFLKMVSTS